MNTFAVSSNRLRRASEAGFSLALALVAVLFIAFVAAILMNLMRIRYAILGFIAVVIIAALISAIPDMVRYVRISSM